MNHSSYRKERERRGKAALRLNFVSCAALCVHSESGQLEKKERNLQKLKKKGKDSIWIEQANMCISSEEERGLWEPNKIVNSGTRNLLAIDWKSPSI